MEMQHTISTPMHAPRAAKTGWREEETQLLWQQVRAASEEGAPLREVFERVAASLGRKPNSIRNYYYAQLKERDEPALKRATPFETFSEDEVHALVRTVLRRKGEGMSVRACVTEMAGGDKSLMLRYQNKYRSTLRSRPALIQAVMEELEHEGLPCTNPYAAQSEPTAPDALLAQTRDRLAHTEDPALAQLLTGLNALLDRVQAPESPVIPLPSCDRVLIERDRLSARNDLLRIALDDEQGKREALCEAGGELLSVIRSFLAGGELARAQQLGAFCQALAQQAEQFEAQVERVH